MKNIVDLVNAIITSVKPHLGGVPVFRGEPKTEKPADQMYVTVEINNDPTLSQVDQRVLMSIRVVGVVNGPKKAVYDTLHIINSHLLTAQESYGYDVYKVTTTGLSPYLLSDKGRGELVRDFYFYFVT